MTGSVPAALRAEGQQFIVERLGDPRRLPTYQAGPDSSVPQTAPELGANPALERGLVAHQMAEGRRHLLVEAIRSYQSALMVLSEERMLAELLSVRQELECLKQSQGTPQRDTPAS